MRLRHGPRSVPREAAPDPELIARLRAARLYVITPDVDPDRVMAIASAAQRGGAEMIQLRHKTLSRGELLSLARSLRRVITSALFVVNDHVDIAMLCGADGAHLGSDDLSIASARKVAGDRLLIGASASSLEAARAAMAGGADYLGCGPAFATPIKSEKAVIGPEGIAAIRSAVGSATPVFAIGGIDESNLGLLTGVGLRRACVIRAVSDSDDPEGAARRLRAMLDA